MALTGKIWTLIKHKNKKLRKGHTCHGYIVQIVCIYAHVLVLWLYFCMFLIFFVSYCTLRHKWMNWFLHWGEEEHECSPMACNNIVDKNKKIERWIFNNQLDARTNSAIESYCSEKNMTKLAWETKKCLHLQETRGINRLRLHWQGYEKELVTRTSRILDMCKAWQKEKKRWIETNKGGSERAGRKVGAWKQPGNPHDLLVPSTKGRQQATRLQAGLLCCIHVAACSVRICPFIQRYGTVCDTPVSLRIVP
jgi:hypothetical protein